MVINDPKTKKDEFVTREQMEINIALTRVETLLAVHRDDFLEHAKRDDETFTELFNLSRNIHEEVHNIPSKITACSEELEKRIHKDMENSFVSKEVYAKFTNRITYTLSGIMLFGVFLTWVISVFVDVTKLTGS